MAMMLFTLLNGLGVVFLMYVLVQFWKEGHKPEKETARARVMELPPRRRHKDIVLTHPISQCVLGGPSVVSSRTRMSSLQDGPIHGNSARGEDEMPVKRYSSR